MADYNRTLYSKNLEGAHSDEIAKLTSEVSHIHNVKQLSHVLILILSKAKLI